MTAATAIQQPGLETITGDLRAYSRLVPGTFLHADQLTTARQTDSELRNCWFYTADGPLYSLEGTAQTPTLFLTRESDNLILRHIDDAFEQLRTTGNYRPNVEEARQAMQAESTLRVNLTKLRLQGDDAEWRYLEINTQKYDKLNQEERKLAERYFGQGNDFVENMKVLEKARVDFTRVFVLDPNYVQKEAQNGAIGRASWLYSFYDLSYAYASGRLVYNHFALRGVCRVDREAAAPQNAGVPEVPSAPVAASEVKVATMEEILAFTRQSGFVAERVWGDYEAGVRQRIMGK